MTKQEILDAINATIAPNGQKGITAESLANILTEIVNAAGEGGGGVVFYMGAKDQSSTSLVLTADQKTHNAAQFQIVKNSPVALTGDIDVSLMTPEMAALGAKVCYPLDFLQYIPYEIAVEGGYETDIILFTKQALLGSNQFVVLPDGSMELLTA